MRTVMVFNTESGQVVPEVHEVLELYGQHAAWETATKYFNAEPLWLEILFYGPLTEDDLYFLYDTCIKYKVFEVADVAAEIKEDLDHMPVGKWNIKCHNFRDAFDCAMAISNYIDADDLWQVQLSEKPPEGTKDHEKDYLDTLIDQVQDFDPKVYYDDHITYVNIDTENERKFCDRLVNAMIKNGATEDEIKGIIKYAMVVLDAEKEKLDWMKAADDFQVKRMRNKYYLKTENAAET